MSFPENPHKNITPNIVIQVADWDLQTISDSDSEPESPFPLKITDSTGTNKPQISEDDLKPSTTACKIYRNSSSSSIRKASERIMSLSSSSAVVSPASLGLDSLDYGKTPGPRRKLAESKDTIQASVKGTKVLKTGIPLDSTPAEVIDDVVSALSFLKLSIPLDKVLGKADQDAGADPTKPIPPPPILTNATKIQQSTPVSRSVIEHLGNIIGDWKIFFPQDTSHRDLVHERLKAKFKNGDYADADVDDTGVFRRYKPMELIADLFIHIILELIDGQCFEVVDASERLRKVLQGQDTYKQAEFREIYSYLIKTLTALVESMFLSNDGQSTVEVPSDADWSPELRYNRFIIWYFVQRSLAKEAQWSAYEEFLPPGPGELNDVEWLVTVANSLRDKRLKSMFPGRISEMERNFVKRAYALEPKNPFVILTLLDILSSKKKELSSQFLTTCRNIVHEYPKSVYLLLRVAKLFLERGCNQHFVHQAVKRAIGVNSMHPEANFLCAKHLCKDVHKIDVGVRYRDAFYRLAMISDVSNVDHVLEYFRTGLGARISSAPVAASLFSPSGPEGDSELLNLNTGTGRVLGGASLGEYQVAIDLVLVAPHSKAWPAVARAELNLLSSFSSYLRMDFGESLELLLTAYKYNQIVAIIENLDKYRLKYGWGKALSFEKYKLWLIEEYEDILCMEREAQAEDYDGSTDDDIDEENFQDCMDLRVNENSRLDDDPVKEMLASLIQLL